MTDRQLVAAYGPAPGNLLCLAGLTSKRSRRRLRRREACGRRLRAVLGLLLQHLRPYAHDRDSSLLGRPKANRDDQGEGRSNHVYAQEHPWRPHLP